jgi:hypothetical protein
MWIKTLYGWCNSAYVVRIERDNGGSLLHLIDGSVVRSNLLFDVDDNGKLEMIEPDDDDWEDCPF